MRRMPAPGSQAASAQGRPGGCGPAWGSASAAWARCWEARGALASPAGVDRAGETETGAGSRAAWWAGLRAQVGGNGGATRENPAGAPAYGQARTPRLTALRQQGSQAHPTTCPTAPDLWESSCKGSVARATPSRRDQQASVTPEPFPISHTSTVTHTPGFPGWIAHRVIHAFMPCALSAHRRQPRVGLPLHAGSPVLAERPPRRARSTASVCDGSHCLWL